MVCGAMQVPPCEASFIIGKFLPETGASGQGFFSFPGIFSSLAESAALLCAAPSLRRALKMVEIQARRPEGASNISDPAIVMS
jgi:hypothetical protein